MDRAGSHAVPAFCFVIELEQPLPTEPHDSDIDRCLWLSADEILQAPNLRSALVAESIRSYQQPERYPLSLVGSFARRFKGAGQHKMNSAPARQRGKILRLFYQHGSCSSS